MGMYDEFIIKIPIQCPNCYTGAINSFQTKELGCNLDIYREGEPAHQYGYRGLNEQEIIERNTYNQINYPSGSILENFPFMVPDTTKLITTLPDGKYPVYNYCFNCDTFFYVYAVIKNGIFMGVEPCEGYNDEHV